MRSRSPVGFGVSLMAIAMLSIPMADGIAKYLSADYSPLLISWLRYAIAACLIVPISLARFGARCFPERELGAHTLRTVFLVTAMTLYFMALARVPMATASGAFFISPIVASVVAVLFFGERFSIPKAFALVLGFAGVLVIARPAAALPESGVLLAIAAGLAFAAYLVATRLASRSSEPIRTLTFQCVVGALLLFPQAVLSWQWPARDSLLLFVALAAISVCSHLLSITAFRHAETSLLAPLVYLELVGAVLIGYLVFSDVPEPPVWIGAGMIVAGGLVVSRTGR